jgi:membrane protease YdiL (CAAX protease family)
MTQSQFLTTATVFQGSVLVAAFIAGWLTGVSPTGLLDWSLADFLTGVLATGPMLILLAACVLTPVNGLQDIRKFLRDFLGPFLSRCHWYELLLLALLAGVCEEIAFRGFLYVWIREWNPFLAIFATNFLFGLAHSVTPLYAMLAGFIGLYLTALLEADATPNLLIPITAHALYDLVAFAVVIRDYQRHPPIDESQNDPS